MQLGSDVIINNKWKAKVNIKMLLLENVWFNGNFSFLDFGCQQFFKLGFIQNLFDKGHDMKIHSSMPGTPTKHPSRAQPPKSKHYLSINKYNAPINEKYGSPQNKTDPLKFKMHGVDAPLNLFNQRTIYKHKITSKTPIRHSYTPLQQSNITQKACTDRHTLKRSMQPVYRQDTIFDYNSKTASLKEYTNMVNKEIVQNRGVTRNLQAEYDKNQGKEPFQNKTETKIIPPNTPQYQPHHRHSTSTQRNQFSCSKKRQNIKYLTVVSRMPINKKTHSLLFI